MTESIVLQVCRERKIRPDEFFGPKRDQRLTTARRIAIKRLIAAGFNMAGAARMIRRNYSTVRYWMNPKLRAAHNERARNYWRKLNAGRASEGSFVREEAVSAACVSDAGLHGCKADCHSVRHQAAHDIGIRTEGWTQGQERQGAGGLEA